MKFEPNYIDDNPTPFRHDRAMDITKQASKFLKQHVIIKDRRYKFTQMDNYKYIVGTDTSSTCFLFGTLLSDEMHMMTLSLDKIIAHFEGQ